MNWTKRKGTTGKIEPSKQFLLEEKLTFQKKISGVIFEHDTVISNWKIISNCSLPAFVWEVLVNYASNMIRIRLIIAPSLENNENFGMVSIICKNWFLSGQYAGSSSTFLQIKTLVEIERPPCYASGSL